jgi:peroxiredoxin
MRLTALAALFGSLALAAGCGPPPLSDGPAGPPDLPKVAAQFHADPKSNPEAAAKEVPLKFVDTDGNAVDLASFRDRAAVVLVVVKGLPRYPGGKFCPGCLAQVNSLAANNAEFKKRGAEVLVVFPGPKDTLPQFLADSKVAAAGEGPKVPFPLLLDTDLNAVRALGITGDLAKPSTYILDKKGNVVFAFVGETTTDRPSVQAVLGQLDKLNAPK